MKLPKLGLFSGKKSRSSSEAGSSRSSSGAATPVRNSSEIKGSGEISTVKASPKVVSGQSSEIVLAQAALEQVEQRLISYPSPSTARHLEHQELSDCFRLIDVNKDGKISPTELGSVLGSLGYASSEEELKLMLEAVDADGDGYIDLQEFINLNTVVDKAGGSPARTKELKAAFSVFDIDKNNFISAEELHQVLKGLGEKSTIEDCSRMIRGVDSDGDGQVNFEEFERMMRSTCVH